MWLIVRCPSMEMIAGCSLRDCSLSVVKSHLLLSHAGWCCFIVLSKVIQFCVTERTEQAMALLCTRGWLQRFLKRPEDWLPWAKFWWRNGWISSKRNRMHGIGGVEAICRGLSESKFGVHADDQQSEPCRIRRRHFPSSQTTAVSPGGQHRQHHFCKKESVPSFCIHLLGFISAVKAGALVDSGFYSGSLHMGFILSWKNHREEHIKQKNIKKHRHPTHSTVMNIVNQQENQVIIVTKLNAMVANWAVNSDGTEWLYPPGAWALREQSERCFYRDEKQVFLFLTGSNRIVRKIKDFFDLCWLIIVCIYSGISSS